MEDSTVFIIGAIVAVIVFVIILSGRKKKKTSSAAPTTAPGTFRGTLPVNPTPTPTPPPKPATPPKRPEGGTRNSVFSYTARSAVWVCPNCACENSPDSTHCCVCFWDKSVGVK